MEHLNKLNLMYFLRQQGLLVISLYVMCLGVALFVRSGLGSSAISSLPLVCSEAGLKGVTLWNGTLHIPAMTIGEYTLIMNAIFVILQILILRSRYQWIQLFQLLIGFLFGILLDVNMYLTHFITLGNDSMDLFIGLLIVLIGGAVMGVGIACEVRCQSVMMPGEGIQVALAKVTNKEFGKVKIVTDVSLVILAIICCYLFFGRWRFDIVGIGTLVSMVYVGIMVRFFSRRIGWFDRLLNAPVLTTEPDKSVEDTAFYPLVITISRKFGSGGHEVGKRLAKQLNFAFYDRQILLETAANMHLSPQEVEMSEQNISSVKLFELMITENYLPKGTVLDSDEQMYIIQSRIIKKLAEEPCIIIGRCADFVLRNRTNVLRVFIQSDLDFAAQRVAREQGLTPEQAVQKVKQVNDVRANHYRQFTDKRWGDPRNYDLVLDTSVNGIEGAVLTIQQFIKERNKMIHA